MHSRIRTIVLTYPDDIALQKIISRNHACLQNHTNHNHANIISIEIFAPFPFVPVRVKTLARFTNGKKRKKTKQNKKTEHHGSRMELFPFPESRK